MFLDGEQSQGLLRRQDRRARCRLIDICADRT